MGTDALEVWEDVIDGWLAGEERLDDELRAWQSSYAGRGRGAVDTTALPELYHGNIYGQPAAAILALNPGQVYPDFQHRGGIFEHELRTFGSYRAWAASWPYLRQPWVSVVGPNRHYRRRLMFLRRWFDQPELPADKMLAFELYPWHSTSVTASMRPNPATVHRFIWEPLVSIGVREVFAFGAPWLPLLEHRLGLPVVDRLGIGGRDYGSTAAGRTVVVFDADGLRVVAAKHNGPAGPPSAAETLLLRDALD